MPHSGTLSAELWLRGTGDKKTMSLAATLYEKVIGNFKPEQFAKFEFPRIVKEDWPNIFKIKYQMADLLYFQKDWAKCGPAFDAVVAEDPTGPTAPEAAYASVLCYQNIYLDTHKDGSDKKGGGNLPTSAKKADKNLPGKPPGGCVFVERRRSGQVDDSKLAGRVLKPPGGVRCPRDRHTRSQAGVDPVDSQPRRRERPGRGRHTRTSAKLLIVRAISALDGAST